MIKYEQGTMVNLKSWKEYANEIPLVAVVGLMGEWMTIYACMQQAIKNFDYVIVCGDGITPKAMKMFEKFMSDYSSQVKGRVHLLEMDKIDPWPWVAIARPGVLYEKLEDIPKKSWSKAGFKRFNYARSLFPNSILCSLHSDVIVFDDTGSRIKGRIATIENPFFDSEWFSMVSMYDKHHIAGIVDPISTPGNLVKHSHLRQRTWYDYPGDWGLMGYYASSMLSVGPDPQGSEAECFYPWSKKTQCEKKGFDDSIPHAVHYEWLREKYKDTEHRASEWRTAVLNNGSIDDPELSEKLKTVEDVYFPVKFYLDNSWILRIEET